MKTNTNYLWQLFNKEKDAQFQASNAADNYFVFLGKEGRLNKRFKKTVTLGPKSLATKEFIWRITSAADYPPLPKLESNKELRKLNEPRAKSPLFKVIASKVSEKYNSVKSEVSKAIAEEKSKVPADHILYRLEYTTEILPEEKEPAEILDTKELSPTL